MISEFVVGTNASNKRMFTVEKKIQQKTNQTTN